MAPSAERSSEALILRARETGEISCDTAFERFHEAYASVLLAWFALRAHPAEIDDLAQDVWAIFYMRWRRWQFLPEMDVPDARPVLSFLYRTCNFVFLAHRRQHASRSQQLPLEVAETKASSQPVETILRTLEFGRALKIAKEICTPAELDVLAGRLAGVPLREVARATNSTEAVVDHRFRNAMAKLRKRLSAKGKPRRSDA